MTPRPRAKAPQPYKRKSDGLWVAPYYDATGRRRVAYGKTVEAALDARARKLNGYDDSQTVGQFLRWWVDVHLARRVASGKLQETTRRDYADDVRRYLTDGLGHIRLVDLTPQHVEDFLAGMLATVSDKTGKPLSGRTVQHAHTTLKAALTVAVRYGLPRNVAALVESPSVSAKPFVELTVDQTRTFLTACRGDRLGTLWTVALACGLRIGEALALSWDDVDFDKRQMRVAWSLTRIDGEWIRKDVKGHQAVTLALPGFATRALTERRDVQQLDWMVAGDLWANPWDLVFTRSDGSPIWWSTAGRWLEELCESVGLPRLTPHQLRHNCATLLSAQGASLQEIQGLLRHRHVATTSDVYVHMVEGVRRDHADRMDRLIEGEGP